MDAGYDRAGGSDPSNNGNPYSAYDSRSLKSLKQTIGRAAAENTEAETNMTHIMNRAVSRDGGGSGSAKKK